VIRLFALFLYLFLSTSAWCDVVADERPMIWPARLKRGGTIMFVAPAGDLKQERMMLAKQRLEQRG